MRGSIKITCFQIPHNTNAIIMQEHIRVPINSIQTILNLTANLYNYRIWHIISYCVLVIHILPDIVYVYNICKRFDTSLLINYGPIFFLILSGIGGNFYCFLLTVPLQSVIAELIESSWSLKSAESSIIKQILIESRVAKFFFFLNVCLTSSVAISFTPVFTKSYNIIYATDFVRDNFPKYSFTFNIIYFSTFPLIGYYMLINLYHLICAMLVIKFQKYLLNSKLKELNLNHRKLDKPRSIRHYKQLQLNIRETMKCCITHHGLLKSFEHRVTNVVFFPFLLLFTLAVLMLISMFFSVINKQGLGNGKLAFALFSISVTMVYFLYCGQSSIDASDQLYINAINCSWTSWSIDNQKMLVIFLQNLQKVPVVGIGGILECRYSMIIKVLRCIGSALSFFIQVLDIQVEV